MDELTTAIVLTANISPKDLLANTSHIPRETSRLEAPKQPYITSEACHLHDSILKSGEIRLVTIDRDLTDSEFIVCHVEKASFSADFVAVSYASGSDDLTSSINLNGQLVGVGSECERLLRALRQQYVKDDVRISGSGGQRKKVQRRFWIDSLCMNQHNIQDQNVQVAQMDDIYCKAQKTVVYLGEHDTHFAIILNHMQSDGLADYRRVKRLRSPHFEDRQPVVFPSIESVMAVPHTGLDDHVGSHRRESAIISVASTCSWFQRKWAIPVILLSRRVEILVSPDCDSLPEGRPKTVSLRRFRSSSRELPMPLKLQDALSETQYRTKGKLELPLWRLFMILASTRGLQCDDPRDHIFAVTSLFHKPRSRLLQPNYNITVSETYTDAAWFLINYNVSEAILAAGTSGSPTNIGNIPSWVIDWRDSSYMSLLTQRNLQAGFTNGQKQIIASRDGQALILRGLKVSVIQYMASEKTFGSHAGENLPVNDALTLIKSFLPQFSGRCEQSKIKVESEMEFDEVLSTLYQGNTALWEVLPYMCLKSASKTASTIQAAITHLRRDRRPILLEDGRLAIGATHAQIGDHLCVFLGVEIPMLLRPAGYSWQLLGQCIVPGIMHGEAVQDVDWTTVSDSTAKAPLQDFRII